jgi:hypothetical protein
MVTCENQQVLEPQQQPQPPDGVSGDCVPIANAGHVHCTTIDYTIVTNGTVLSVHSGRSIKILFPVRIGDLHVLDCIIQYGHDVQE